MAACGWNLHAIHKTSSIGFVLRHFVTTLVKGQSNDGDHEGIASRGRLEGIK